MCSQVTEWIKGIYDADETARRTSALLSEIRRAVTRFESISFDIHVAIPVDDPSFRDVQTDVQEVVSANVRAGKSRNGFRVVTKNRDDFMHAIIQFDPQGSNQNLARIVDNRMPEIELYKTPQDLTKSDRPGPDLKLIVTPKGPSLSSAVIAR